MIFKIAQDVIRNILMKMGAFCLPGMCPLTSTMFLKKTDEETKSGLWGQQNWQFHETLYRSANRPKLLILIRNMHNNIERYMRLYLSKMNYQTKSQGEHRALLNACTQRDIKAAQKLLRKHMADANASLSGYLSQ